MTVGASGATTAHHLAVILLPADRPRDVFRTMLADRGIQTSVHYPPIERFTYYRSDHTERRLAMTEAVASRIVTLPLYPHMGEGEITAVTSAVLEAVA